MGRCQHCRKKLTLTPELVGKTGLCPHCGRETPLIPIRPWPELPSWAGPTAIIISLSLILASIGYGQLRSFFEGLPGWENVPHWRIFLGYFIMSAAGVLWISWLIYVAISLREMRSTLKQIELNTGRPGPPSAAVTMPPKPPTPPGEPPQDWRYVPRV